MKNDIQSDIQKGNNKSRNKSKSRKSKPGNKSKLGNESKLDDKHDKDLIDAFEELRKLVEDNSPLSESPSTEKLLLPDVFIVFDKAHPLTTPFNPEGIQSHSSFVELRQALRVFSDELLFTFFLSTTGKISQFSLPRGCDASNRMNDGKLITPNPFIYFGFDHLMRNCKIFDKYKTLDDVTSLECIAHMGRPL